MPELGAGPKFTGDGLLHFRLSRLRLHLADQFFKINKTNLHQVDWIHSYCLPALLEMNTEEAGIANTKHFVIHFPPLQGINVHVYCEKWF